MNKLVGVREMDVPHPEIWHNESLASLLTGARHVIQIDLEKLIINLDYLVSYLNEQGKHEEAAAMYQNIKLARAARAFRDEAVDQVGVGMAEGAASSFEKEVIGDRLAAIMTATKRGKDGKE